MTTLADLQGIQSSFGPSGNADDRQFYINNPETGGREVAYSGWGTGTPGSGIDFERGIIEDQSTFSPLYMPKSWADSAMQNPNMIEGLNFNQNTYRAEEGQAPQGLFSGGLAGLADRFGPQIAMAAAGLMIPGFGIGNMLFGADGVNPFSGGADFAETGYVPNSAGADFASTGFGSAGASTGTTNLIPGFDDEVYGQAARGLLSTGGGGGSSNIIPGSDSEVYGEAARGATSMGTPGIGDPSGGMMTATGAAAPAAGLLSQIKTLISGATRGIGGSAGFGGSPGGTGGSSMLGSLSTMASLGSGIYGLLESRKLKDQAGKLQTTADPWGASGGRAVADTQLQKLLLDPSAITTMPGYEAGIQAVERKMASQGYNGSGNMMTALQKYGGDFYQQALQSLGQFSGATVNPGTSADIALRTTTAGNDLASKSLASLGYGINGGTGNSASDWFNLMKASGRVG